MARKNTYIVLSQYLNTLNISFNTIVKIIIGAKHDNTIQDNTIHDNTI